LSSKKSYKLTKIEKRLLEYPPNPDTWECQGILSNSEKCTMGNNAKNTKCVVCGTIKPKRPKKYWKTYVEACNKVGIIPGEQLFKVFDGVPKIRNIRGTGWRPIEWEK